MILFALQDEIKSLIERQQGLMQRLKSEEAIWQQQETTAMLSPAELDRQVAALASDTVKVQALESKIAVIGTMKAGKSTTINALIGTEVLPHRLTAMTTLPTLIRHMPGQQEPVLRLPRLGEFKALLDEVTEKLTTLDEDASDLSKVAEALKVVKDRAEDIREKYVGKEAIHQALFLINDTFRLAGHESFGVNLDNYLKHFTDISSLPTVEVEFRCFAGKPESMNNGSLALLDTPGPNEAGQSKVLKQILAEQIEKNASMVLLVMNYTQLDTEQDAEIRNQIRGIKEVFRNRSFVVVNRFDERKQYDLDEVQTRKKASDLLNSSIDDDDFITSNEVFPVSSHYAFIVERVRQQIDQGVPISEFLNNPQNKDFIKAAFGELDEDEIDELSYEQINSKRNRLFNRSGYEAFTKNMLEKAYTKAGESSLQGALARLKENAKNIDIFSTAVAGGLASEMDALSGSIERTKNLIESIQAVYARLDEVKGAGIAEYRVNARKTLLEHVDAVKEKIGEQFNAERINRQNNLKSAVELKSDQQEKLQRNPWIRKGSKDLQVIESELENLLAELDKYSQNDDGVLDFGSNRQGALSFSNKASAAVGSLFSSMVDSLQQQLSELENKTQKQIQVELFGPLEKLFNTYEAEMKDKGFAFNVSLANSFSLDVLAGSDFDVDLSESIENYSETITRKHKKKVRRDGWVHKTLRFFSLGMRDNYVEVVESKTTEVSRYKITLDDYVLEAKRLADSFCRDIEARLTRQFEEKLIPAVDGVVSRAVHEAKGIEEALDNSKKLKAESVSIINEIKVMMEQVKNDNLSHCKRIEVASRGIESLAL